MAGGEDEWSWFETTISLPMLHGLETRTWNFEFMTWCASARDATKMTMAIVDLAKTGAKYKDE